MVRLTESRLTEDKRSMKEQYISLNSGPGSGKHRKGRRLAEPEQVPEEPEKTPSLFRRLLTGFLKLIAACCILAVMGYFIWPVIWDTLYPAGSPAGPGTSASVPEGPDLSDPEPLDPTEPGQTAAGLHTRRKQVYSIVLLGKDVGSGNTDTIILVSYDIPRKKVGMISIPRDTAVDRTWSTYPKINGAFFGAGADTLKEEIQNTFGIPVDYYVLVDLQGFIALVDELGGVDVEIPVDMNYDDPTPNAELHIHFQKGMQHLDGQACMEAVRYRHDNNNPDGTPGPNQDYTDLGRGEFQRQVLKALVKKVLSWNSLPRISRFVRLFETYVDTDLTASEIFWLAVHAIGVDVDSAVTSGALSGRGDATVSDVPWCFVYKAEDILPVLNEQVNPYEEPLTEEDLHLPEAQSYAFNY